jgi:transposase
LRTIADIHRITRQTVSVAITEWEENGISGFYDNPRPGKPRSLTPDDEEFIFEMMDEEPRSVKKIIAVPEDQRGKKVSRSTVKRVIKKAGVETNPKIS